MSINSCRTHCITPDGLPNYTLSENGGDDEWEIVGNWMWRNRDVYNGLSVLNYDGGSYIQAPFQDITKDEYEKRISSLSTVDLTKVMEIDDTVDFGSIQACGGGQCDINI